MASRSQVNGAAVLSSNQSFDFKREDLFGVCPRRAPKKNTQKERDSNRVSIP